MYKNVAHENEVGISSLIGFPLVIADSEQDIPGIQPGTPDYTPALSPLDWNWITLTLVCEQDMNFIYKISYTYSYIVMCNVNCN